MALTVATNTGALMAQAAASSVNKEMEISMERLSTGKRINSAADDAAGVAIASRLTSEIKGTNQAIRNAMDGQAMIDTAEGAHQEVESILQRMRELAVQASNDSNSDADRTALQSEVTALVAEIDRIANVSTWAGKGLIDQARSFTFNVGSHGGGHNEIVASTKAMTGAALGVAAGNSAVGVNGATLSEVGGSVIQVGGTPVVGDVYNFTLNGETFEVEIKADDGTDFSFDYKLNGGAVPAGAAATTVDEADITGLGGNDVHAVAKAIAGFVNANADTTDGGSQGGMTATAASDGSVTLVQTVSVTNAAHDNDGTDVAGVWSISGNTLTFTDLGADADYAAADDGLAFTINGVTFDVGAAQEGTFNMATKEGVAAAINAEIAAHKGDILGITNLTAAQDGTNITISWDPATTLTNVSATPKQSTTALQIDTQADASAAIATIDAAIVLVNSQRANLGAISNRLDSTVNNLTSISSNLAAGRGRIEDADFAAETTSLAKSQILQQASTAMLAQANASKQNVLSLLQG